MKAKLQEIIDELDNNTNLYPIYPEMYDPVSPEVVRSEEVEDEELTQQVNRINPDPNSLDRG